MIGKMVREVKNIHNNKPEEITLRDGTVTKSILCNEDPKGDIVWTRKIKLNG